MNIKFTRDSISVEDDYKDSERNYILPDDIVWSDIIPFLKENAFIPTILGNDSVWVLLNDDGSEILSHFTKLDKTLTFKDTSWNVEDFKHFHLKYYSSRLKRGEKVFIDNSCSDYYMWHDGAMTEFELCDVPKIEKEQWKQNHLSTRHKLITIIGGMKKWLKKE